MWEVASFLATTEIVDTVLRKLIQGESGFVLYFTSSTSSVTLSRLTCQAERMEKEREREKGQLLG